MLISNLICSILLDIQRLSNTSSSGMGLAYDHTPGQQNGERPPEFLTLILLVGKLLESVNHTGQTNIYIIIITCPLYSKTNILEWFPTSRQVGSLAVEREKNIKETKHTSLNSSTFIYTSRHNITAKSSIPIVSFIVYFRKLIYVVL